MANYRFPLPHNRGGNSNNNSQTPPNVVPSNDISLPPARGLDDGLAEEVVINDPAQLVNANINDLFLHVLFARVALADGSNHEFEAKYDKASNSIELDLPENLIEFIETIHIHDKMQRYIAWLISFSQFWYATSNGITTDHHVVVNSIRFSDLYDNQTSANIDWRNGNKQIVTVVADTMFTFNDPFGTTSLQIIIKQDSIGGHNVVFPSYLKWPNGIMGNVTILPNAEDVLSLLFDGVNYYATLIKNFK